ncbi:MAG: PPOX class F420-dependent oxidoreductase [Chloroflexota bacterium]
MSATDSPPPRGGLAPGAPLESDETREFLNGPWLCRLATLDADGAPYINPLWYEYDGAGYLIVARERAAFVEHIRRDPRVSLCIDDPDGTHRRVNVQGRAEIVEGPTVRGSWLPIAERMALRYMGSASGNAYMQKTLDYPRFLIRVVPEKTTTWSGGWARKYTA